MGKRSAEYPDRRSANREYLARQGTSDIGYPIGHDAKHRVNGPANAARVQSSTGQPSRLSAFAEGFTQTGR